ncbi:uncharacterized protein MONOS_15774 [Monocercomonoides exilis]|uniref:uncharacterized protein n=1 Tax=Monocercomonoides exilis TaxID=2049356 RepID=UPI0035598743|nr:hypothetical protein MONOS_15774 [Monocercomonoides exilis]|eukprot:MONOS_15774.1-p1 / transcript=MONOS_15774.1 / gene=MONOS_15774 / organism=Monocercomonoides_exilis_PA203 / gene_product=unspecified product / transcript_product=unspecified product / location=Mono_scaffold01351:6972-9828(-) / protein_length=853 / sequence_SO=supercontig / SO=protein_coding / is_pseudo=false
MDGKTGFVCIDAHKNQPFSNCIAESITINSNNAVKCGPSGSNVSSSPFIYSMGTLTQVGHHEQNSGASADFLASHVRHPSSVPICDASFKAQSDSKVGNEGERLLSVGNLRSDEALLSEKVEGADEKRECFFQQRVDLGGQLRFEASAKKEICEAGFIPSLNKMEEFEVLDEIRAALLRKKSALKEESGESRLTRKSDIGKRLNKQTERETEIIDFSAGSDANWHKSGLLAETVTAQNEFSQVAFAQAPIDDEDECASSSSSPSPSSEAEACERIASWQPSEVRSQMLCGDIDAAVGGRRQSRAEHASRMALVAKWKEEDELWMRLEKWQGVSECVAKGQTDSSADADAVVVQKERGNLGSGLLAEDGHQLDCAHGAELGNEGFVGLKRRRRARLTKRQIREAKEHWKLFGEWVRKGWMFDGAEAAEWDKAEAKIGRAVQGCGKETDERAEAAMTAEEAKRLLDEEGTEGVMGSGAQRDLRSMLAKEEREERRQETEKSMTTLERFWLRQSRKRERKKGKAKEVCAECGEMSSPNSENEQNDLLSLNQKNIAIRACPSLFPVSSSSSSSSSSSAVTSSLLLPSSTTKTEDSQVNPLLCCSGSSGICSSDDSFFEEATNCEQSSKRQSFEESSCDMPSKRTKCQVCLCSWLGNEKDADVAVMHRPLQAPENAAGLATSVVLSMALSASLDRSASHSAKSFPSLMAANVHFHPSHFDPAQLPKSSKTAASSCHCSFSDPFESCFCLEDAPVRLPTQPLNDDQLPCGSSDTCFSVNPQMPVCVADSDETLPRFTDTVNGARKIKRMQKRGFDPELFVRQKKQMFEEVRSSSAIVLPFRLFYASVFQNVICISPQR